MPRVYYGLKQGPQTYRCLLNDVINVEENTGNIGDSFEFINEAQQEDYIAAVAVKINETQLQIVIRGDYQILNDTFNIVNMRSGDSFQYVGNILTLQDASSLADYPAPQNPEKQITVLKDLELNRDNIVFASLDYNSDNVYNWVRIGGYVNGQDGNSVWGINSTNASMVYDNIKVNDTIVAVEAFSYNETNFKLGDIYLVTQINPSIELSLQSNIQGPQGEPGQNGAKGEPGQNGLTPSIQDGYWWIGSTNTGVKAIGEDGTNGQDGKAFNIQSEIFSTPENQGKEGNITPEGETLKTLPTLPQTGISGKGYVVYDPLTTPLQPYYDLYWANDGDTEWSIMHPFSGLAGKDGKDGQTPYIKDNNWWIGNTNTGVQATGTSGATGATGPQGVSMWAFAKPTDFMASNSPFVKVGDYIVAGENIRYPSGQTAFPKGTVVKVTALTETFDPGYFRIDFVRDSTANAMNLSGPTGPKGPKGDTGATPNISATATSLPAGTEPTVNVTGTAENPILNLGIPGAGKLYQVVFSYTSNASSEYLGSNFISLVIMNETVYKKYITNGSQTILSVSSMFNLIRDTRAGISVSSVNLLLVGGVFWGTSNAHIGGPMTISSNSISVVTVRHDQSSVSAHEIDPTKSFLVVSIGELT